LKRCCPTKQNGLPSWKFLDSCGCTLFDFLDVIQDEGAVSVLFGIGQRWMTTPPPPILTSNSGDLKSVSSVTLPQYLRLDSSKPLVQTPESSTEESPSEWKLVCSTLEALEVGDAVSSSPSCRRISDGCLAPFSIFSNFFLSGHMFYA
jgi:hypothetical protein